MTSKRAHILLLLAMLSTYMLAQPHLRYPEMYVGVHGGVMASMVTFTPTVANMTPITNACILGGNGGLVFRYSGHKCCGLQVELNYMQRGWREKNTEAGVDYQRHLDYLELPFLTHIYFGKPQWRGFINLGPQIGYCLRDAASGTSAVAGKQYAPIDNRFDWGVAGGLGFYFRSHNAGLYQLEARFNYSLGTLYSNRAADYFSASNAMNLSINLAWMWEIKNKKNDLFNTAHIKSR